MAFGLGVIKGMSITLRHYFQTYVVGQMRQPAVAGDLPFPVADGVPRAGMPVSTSGLITVEYPDEKLPVPERFRYVPFLVYEDDPDGERAQYHGIRCTACGICAKVCPPQCIWIVQAKGADGKPRPVPTQFTIDVSICMSCGFCAEFCPFDAIKMDHEYEFSGYERHETWVYDLQELLHPLSYHAAIHPTEYRREVAERQAKEEARRRKAEARPAPAPAASAGGSEGVPAASPPADDLDEARRRKAEARAKMLADRTRRDAEQTDTDAGPEPR